MKNIFLDFLLMTVVVFSSVSCQKRGHNTTDGKLESTHTVFSNGIYPTVIPPQLIPLLYQFRTFKF